MYYSCPISKVFRVQNLTLVMSQFYNSTIASILITSITVRSLLTSFNE